MNNKNLLILFISIVIAMFGFGIVLTVLPFFIEDLGGSGAQFGILLALFGLMQLLFAPVWGKVSDKYGRKPILIIGMIGLGSTMLFFGLASGIWMLYLAQIGSGILSSAMLPVAMAYITDITGDKKRSGAMGKIGAAAGIGVIVGPGFAGILAGISLSAPFFAAAGLCLLTCLIILINLPESLPVNRRLKVVDKISLLEIRGMWEGLKTPIAFALFIAFAINFGKSSFTGAYAFYALERFGSGTEEVGTLLMLVGLIYAVVQGLLVGPLSNKMGEEKVIRLSLLGSSCGFVLMLLAFDYITMLMAAGFFVTFNALLRPANLAIISKKTTITQGTAMGIAESYMSLGRVIGPLWAGFILDVNISYPYISGALFFFVVFLVSLIKKNHSKQEESNGRFEAEMN